MKVAITGRGLITPIGNGLTENEKSLRNGCSGIRFMPEWRELHLESQVSGVPDENPECSLIDKKASRFTTANGKMGIAAAYEALMEANLSLEEIKGKRIAVILGCGGSPYDLVYNSAKRLLDTKKVKRLTPFVVPQTMISSAAANISLLLGLTGESYAVSSACTSGSHAIMMATRLIRNGIYDIVLTGGTEEANWVTALGFDAMKATSRKYNETPEKASRPFDKDRDGFVLAGGAGILILESEASIKSRGVTPKGYISGIAANSNAADMVVPDSASACEVMNMAIQDARLSIKDIGYLNTHGTSTPVGDPLEMRAVKQLFGSYADCVAINSTKSLTGHMIGATGAVEAIFTSIMLEKDFISPTANLENPEDEFDWADLVRGSSKTGTGIRHALSNSFGFGGTNGALVLSKD
jgi:3-oxoacyl-[acyl-carrier-protein] synthase-1